LTIIESKLKGEVSEACKILAMQGLLHESVGHVSARVSTNEFEIRCRSIGSEDGHLFSREEDVRRVTLDGESVEASDDYVLPIEFSLHAELYRARPEVGSIVHAHPLGTLLCGLTGIELLPIRAYTYEPMRIVLDGVASYESAAMIDRKERAFALRDAMVGANVCIMRGHGITTLGRNVAEASMRAIYLEKAARANWIIQSSGRSVVALQPEEEEDVQSENSPAPTANDVSKHWGEFAWRYYRRLMQESEAGRVWPPDKFLP